MVPAPAPKSNHGNHLSLAEVRKRQILENMANESPEMKRLRLLYTQNKKKVAANMTPSQMIEYVEKRQKMKAYLKEQEKIKKASNESGINLALISEMRKEMKKKEASAALKSAKPSK